MDKDSYLLFEMYGKAQCIGRKQSKAEDAEGTKTAKIHGNGQYELNPPLKAMENRYDRKTLAGGGEVYQTPITVEFIQFLKNRDGSLTPFDAENPTEPIVLPEVKGLGANASAEQILQALGYTVTEKDGQTQLDLGENAEGESSNLIQRLEQKSRQLRGPNKDDEEIQIEVRNLATKTLSLLQGVDRYSKANPQLDDDRRAIVTQIGELILKL
jgi:hypothetical protein